MTKKLFLLCMALACPVAAHAQPHAIRGADIMPPLGLPNDTSLTPWLNRASPADTPVFIGGTLGLANLSNAALVAPMLSSGTIGLYQHAVGMGALGAPGVAALLKAWGLGGGGGHGVCETGAIPNYDPAVIGSYMALFGTNQTYPNACVMNLPGTETGTGTYTAPAGSAVPGKIYSQFVTASDLALAEAAINGALEHGAHQVAINDTPNSLSMDLDNPFATSGFWANVRTLYAFGGGGALDVPPSYFVNRETAYQQNIIQQIQWLNAQGLASYVLVSPFLYAGADAAGNTYASAYDPMFFEHLVQMYVALKQAGALPTHWIVENYATPNATPPATSNGPDTTPEGLVTAAMWLATAGKTSPAGLMPSMANGATDAGLQVGPAHPVLSGDPAAVHLGAIHLSDVAGAGTLAGQDSWNAAIVGNSQVNIKGIGQMGGLLLTSTFGLSMQPAAAPTMSPSVPLVFSAVSSTGALVTVSLTGDTFGNLAVTGGLNVSGGAVLHGYTQIGPAGSAAGSPSFPLQFLAVAPGGGSVTVPVTGDQHGNVVMPNVALTACPTADPHVVGEIWCNAHVLTLSGG